MYLFTSIVVYNRGELASGMMKSAGVQPSPQPTHSIAPPTPERMPPVTNPAVSMENVHRNAQFLPHSVTGFGTAINPPNIANLMSKSLVVKLYMSMCMQCVKVMMVLLRLHIVGVNKTFMFHLC